MIPSGSLGPGCPPLPSPSPNTHTHTRAYTHARTHVLFRRWSGNVNLEEFYPGSTDEHIRALFRFVLFFVVVRLFVSVFDIFCVAKEVTVTAGVVSPMSLCVFLFVRYLRPEEEGLLAATVTSKWFSSLLKLSGERVEWKPEASG